MNQQYNNQFFLLKQRDDIQENDQPYINIHDLLFNDHQHNKLLQNENMNNEHKYKLLKSNNHDDQILQSNKDKLSLNERQKIVTRFHYIQLLIEKINQLQLTKHHIIMIIINILMILILIIVFQFVKISSFNISIDAEILVMTRGDPYGGPGGDDLWDDAEIATLTFNDTITRVIGTESVDLSGEPLLLSITFGYSNDRLGREYGGIGRSGPWQDLDSLELSPGEHIDHITIYEGYRNITNPSRNGKLTYIIVGIDFQTDHNQKILYGSRNGIRKEESPKNYFLAYVQGRSGGHIDSLRFTWYKYCFRNSTINEENIL